MATYSTIPAAEEPLVAKPQGKSLKALVAGIHAASLFHYFESTASRESVLRRVVASMASGVDGVAEVRVSGRRRTVGESHGMRKQSGSYPAAGPPAGSYPAAGSRV